MAGLKGERPHNVGVPSPHSNRSVPQYSLERFTNNMCTVRVWQTET